jgi:SAM-dependent methyltransferase
VAAGHPPRAGTRVSLAQLEEHRAVWAAKPVLQRVYQPLFEKILEPLPARGCVLEVGAGPGTLTVYARTRRPGLAWIDSDLTPAPWTRLTADALRLPVHADALSGIAGLDVLHHLARPAAFFGEAARVLKAGAPLALVEPWVTPFSYPIYRWLHPEGCTRGIDPWDPFGASAERPKGAFEGDGALTWKIVRTTTDARWRELGFHPPDVQVLNGFAYLLSLGFRRASLLPGWAAPVLLAVDRGLSPLAPLVGLRVCLVWRRL